MTFQFCPTCGAKLGLRTIGDDGEIPYCDACEKPLFPFSYTCILTLIMDSEHRFAFIQQNGIPAHLFIGVAGYVKQGETLEDTVKREVAEEVGLCVRRVEYVKSYFYEKKDLLMVGFMSHVAHDDFRLSGEVDGAQWFAQGDARGVLPEGSIIQALFDDYVKLRTA